MNYPFRRAMSAAAFAAGIGAVPAAAQLVPNPADIVTAGVGSIQTPRPADRQTVIGVNAGSTRQQEGSTATATVLGPNAVADVSFANLTSPKRTQVADIAGVTAGPIAVTKPNDGGSAVGVGLASAAQPIGSAATLGLASGNAPLTLGVGGRTVALPGSSGLPNLSRALSRPDNR